MKKSLLAAILLTLALSGCTSNVKPWPVYQEQEAKEAAVKEFITNELLHLARKRNTINDMLDAGQITHYEYQLLINKCDEDKANIVPRARKLFDN